MTFKSGETGELPGGLLVLGFQFGCHCLWSVIPPVLYSQPFLKNGFAVAPIPSLGQN